MQALLTLFAMEWWLGRELTQTELQDGSLSKLLKEEDFDEAFNVSTADLNSLAPQSLKLCRLCFWLIFSILYVCVLFLEVSDQLTACTKYVTV